MREFYSVVKDEMSPSNLFLIEFTKCPDLDAQPNSNDHQRPSSTNAQVNAKRSGKPDRLKCAFVFPNLKSFHWKAPAGVFQR